jgi:polyhydroxyalkanoate synthesis regulator phasin
MKGRLLSAEHKEKIRSSLLSRRSNGESIGRPKGGIPWNKGKGKAAPKVKGLRDTKFKKGNTPWNTGKKWPQEIIERMREARKDISLETREKMSKAKKGKHLTAEHIRKVLTRRTPTSLEMKFQNIIEKHKLPYKFVGDGSFMIGRKNPDFININGEKIAIEVYARYFKLRHTETVQEWKEDRERVFKEYGWTAIFFDETQVNERNILRRIGGQ